MVQSNTHVKFHYKWDHGKIVTYKNSYTCEEVKNLEYVLADKLNQKDINDSILREDLNEYINTAVQNLLKIVPRPRPFNGKKSSSVLRLFLVKVPIGASENVGDGVFDTQAIIYINDFLEGKKMEVYI